MNSVSTIRSAIVRVVKTRPIVNAIETPGKSRGCKRHMHVHTIIDTRHHGHWGIWLDKHHVARMALQYTFQFFLSCSHFGKGNAAA
jgi:hypothetical protein